MKNINTKLIIIFTILQASTTQLLAQTYVASTSTLISELRVGEITKNKLNQAPGMPVAAYKTTNFCGAQTGTVVAIDFNYVTPVAIGKYITLSATSTLVEYNVHSSDDAPNINWSRRYKDYKYGDGGGAVDVWRLNSIPANGTLYENTVALIAGAVIGDPDDLFFVPNTGYSGEDSFTYCATDSTGQSNIATVNIRIANTDQYPMPYGIPDPGFGIDETPPEDPAEWPESELAGWYYIDSDSGSCSNSSDYGYPNIPRCSIPPTGASVVAGGKMVLAPSDQPYQLRDSSWQLINFEGVPGNTSWLVGNDIGPTKPALTLHPDRANTGTALRVTGGHLRISGIVFDGVVLNHRGGGMDEVVVRHSEFKNSPASGGGGLTVGLSTDGNGVLAFNIYAHDNGRVESVGLSVERDIHAFVGTNQTDFWILDSRCDENAGDCVQLTNNSSTENVYVGRLVAHSDGENCIDIKDFNGVVVSESDCWDIRRVIYGNGGGNSQNFYVNDEGFQQNHVYFLNNRSWDTGGTNYAASNVGGRVYFIGNISFASPVASGFNSGGGGGSRYVYFNTFTGSEIGIFHHGSGSSFDRYMVGNIIDGASLHQTRLRSSTSVINMLDYNYYTDIGVFASGGSNPTIFDGIAAFTTALGFEINGTEGILTSYIDEPVYDFRITATSDVIDKLPLGIVTSLPFVTDIFNDLSLTVLKDRAGTVRPQNTAWDIGAFELATDLIFENGFE